MKAKRLLGAFLAVGLGLVAMTQAADVHAGAKPKKDTASAPVAPTEPAEAKKPILLPLAGIAWGMNPKQVAEGIDKILDDDFRPIYKNTSPGVKMKELDAQVAEEKDQFRRSRIDFGRLPTGMDASPLRGEYTYQNKEAVMELTRKGLVRHFFFIQEKLWKIIEEVKLTETSPLGKNYQEVVVKISSIYGNAGRVSPPDATHAAVEVDWKDSTSHLRVIQRGDTSLAMAYEDLATLSNLAGMRTFKPVEDSGIDPSVAAIMRGNSDPGPPPAGTKPDPKKKK